MKMFEDFKAKYDAIEFLIFKMGVTEIGWTFHTRMIHIREVSMSEIKFNSFIQAASSYDIEMNSIYVRRKGKIIGHVDFKPYARRNIYSVTKSFTSCAAGFLKDEGIFDESEGVAEAFKEDLTWTQLEKFKEMKLYHLLTMTMGFEKPILMGKDRILLKEREKNWVRYIFNQEVVNMPGEKFLYTNAGSYLLSILLRRRTGQNLVDYLMPRLFEPLGIQKPDIEKDPMGNDFGASGLYLTAEEMGRFGQVYLDGGLYRGNRLLSEDWVKASTSRQVYTGERVREGGHFLSGDQPAEGYGYLFWVLNDGSYAAIGNLGQFILIDREKEAVISLSANYRRNNGRLLRLIRSYILSQI